MPNSRESGAPLRVALVTNIPAPYRVPVFNLLSDDERFHLHVFYAAAKEPDRQWDLPRITHPHTYLKERFVAVFSNFIHFNPDIWSKLRQFEPDVVVTTGYSPTHLLSFLYTRFYRCPHVAMTDGTVESEAAITPVHRVLRKVVLRRTAAFVTASRSGRVLLQRYGAADAKIFAAPLCANLSVNWRRRSTAHPKLDFLFSGRLVEIKNPLFALQVVHGASLRLGRKLSLGVLGSGRLEAAVRDAGTRVSDHVDLRLAGAVSQAEVPDWFLRSSVFLFPTAWDPWGVVANEACLAGVPCVVSPHAGAVGELLIDDVSALVRPLHLKAWVDAAVALLSDTSLHDRLAQRAQALVGFYNFARAAQGIADASRAAASGGPAGA